VRTSGRETDIKKRGWRVNIVEIFCVHMYVNGKMRPVETMPGIGGGRG
jgi:hypothetical protein